VDFYVDKYRYINETTAKKNDTRKGVLIKCKLFIIVHKIMSFQ